MTEIKAGYTATGKTRHILDNWSATSPMRYRSVCNVAVRELDDMQEQFSLSDEELGDLATLEWCGRCMKWAQNMRYFGSIGVSVSTPRPVLDAWLAELGLQDVHLAKVIDMQEWKKARGRVDVDHAC